MYLREFQSGLIYRHLHHPLQFLVCMLGKSKGSGLLLVLDFSLSSKLRKQPKGFFFFFETVSGYGGKVAFKLSILLPQPLEY